MTDNDLEDKIKLYSKIVVNLGKAKRDITKLKAVSALRSASDDLVKAAENRLVASQSLLSAAIRLRNQTRQL